MTRTWVERAIESHLLSPAARDMTEAELVWEYSQANVLGERAARLELGIPAAHYVVLPAGAYADTVSDYIACATRAEVAAQLVDYGYLSNPAVSVFTVPKGYTGEHVIASLAQNVDPYPDYIVERGPRGGVQWNRA